MINPETMTPKVKELKPEKIRLDDPRVETTARPISDEARMIQARMLRRAIGHRSTPIAGSEAEGYEAFATEDRAIAAELGPVSFKTLPAD